MMVLAIFDVVFVFDGVTFLTLETFFTNFT